MTFVESTEDHIRNEGGERHVRSVSDNCWISVLHRLTGFGHMEWETAFCVVDPFTKKHIVGSPFIVRGDWREKLADMPEEELPVWFDVTSSGNRTTFDAVIDVLKSH